MEGFKMKKKILVTYFSCSGVTKNVGHRIASLVEGDEYEIKPKFPILQLI